MLLEHQHGVCAICRTRPARTLCVDHCHVTGQVRGLLCSGCNLGIGQFKDNPALLQAAIAYIDAARAASAGDPRTHLLRSVRLPAELVEALPQTGD